MSRVDCAQPGAGDLPALADALLLWIAAARRDLPWRRRRDPYAVWVSEIMLQQTQAATVVPYYERWLARFPTIAALAAAPLDDVLKAWEGLGYYARARHLHRAAQLVTEKYGGILPDQRTALLALPGIGRYTAGAILSLAYGRPEPVLDGNVRRVLCRLYDIDLDPREPAVEKQLWELAARLVQAAPAGAAGDLNEAMMELGAVVCVPQAPDCPACPVSSACLARARGTQAQRPIRAARPAALHYDAVAAVVRDPAGRWLVAQRPAHGLLGGLWEFPGERVKLRPAGEASPAALAQLLADVVREKLAVEIVPLPGLPFLQVPHAYTHFRITLNVFRAELRAGEPRPAGYAAVRWADAATLASLALPVTDQKVLTHLQAFF